MSTQHNQGHFGAASGHARRRRWSWSGLAALAVICAHLGLAVHGAVHETLSNDSPCAMCAAAHHLCNVTASVALIIAPPVDAAPPAPDVDTFPRPTVLIGHARGPPPLA